MKNSDDSIICIYDDDAPTINEVILSSFDKYLKKELESLDLNGR